jgi:diaminopimelate decarboxylase
MASEKSLAVVLPKTFLSSKGMESCIGGIAIRSLAQQYGTPLFVYDANMLESQYRALRENLPSKIHIFYSVKANPNQRILRFFLSKGCGLEIASAGELIQALHSGCQPENILFAGPGKTSFEIKMALKNGIGEIHAESFNEIARISKLAETANVTAKVALRINPNEEAQGGAMRMGGKPSQFGIDEECLEDALRFIQSQKNIQFQGVHLFTGTQILDESVLEIQYRSAVKIAQRAYAHTGKSVGTLDFGGGLGIPYFAHDRPLDLTKLGARISVLFSEIVHDPAFAGTRFIVEPGRFLVGPAGIYVVQIVDVKISRGKTFVIVNGGMNHHLAASGNLGQILKKNFPIVNLSRFSEDGKDGQGELLDIVGPLCTPLDTIGRAVKLPLPQIGDFLGILQSGAYARAASPLGFLSHVTPPEVMVSNEKCELIRRRGAFDDFLADQQ